MNNISQKEKILKSFLRILKVEVKLSKSEIKVFAYLVECCDAKTGIAYPSIRTISEKTGISAGTVHKAIQSLRKKGLIEIYKVNHPKTDRAINVYEIVIEETKETKENWFNQEILKQVKETKQSVENQGFKQKKQEKSESERINNITKENIINKNINNIYVNVNDNGTETEKKGKTNRKEEKQIGGSEKVQGEVKSEKDKGNTGNVHSKGVESVREKGGGGVQNFDFMVAESCDYGKGAWKKPKVRYKMYAYRQFYREYLNRRFERISTDAVLFFLINTERLVESGSITTEKVMRIIEAVDRNREIINPIGYLVAFFGIGKMRFAFLLPPYKPERKEIKEVEKRQERTERPEVRKKEQNGVTQEEIISYWRSLTDEERKALQRQIAKEIAGTVFSSEEEKKEAVKLLLRNRIRQMIIEQRVLYQERLQLYGSG